MKSVFFRKFLTVIGVALALQFSATAGAEPGQQDAEGWYRQIDQQSPSQKEALNRAERESLLRQVSDNKVANLDMVDHYDKDGQIGFCFGRAMTAHLIARQMGLKGSSIGKLFIVGDLRQGADPEWRFHVTTVVRGAEDGQWYAIDPIMLPPMSTGKPLLASDWIATVRRVWDNKPDLSQRAHVYLVSKDSVLPDETVFAATPHDETGERLVELKFRPEGRPGFMPLQIGPALVYQVDESRQQQHFLGFSGYNPVHPFNFLRLEMVVVKQGENSNLSFEYNGYFTDLLEDLRKPQAFAMTRKLMPALESYARPRTLDAYAGKNLLSFKVPTGE